MAYSEQLSFWHALKGHWQTIVPYLFRKIALPDSISLEIPLSDGDFVDAEYWTSEGKGLALLTHGLEGSSKATYIRALAKSYLTQGWDVLAWNFRGCSGRLNRKVRLYHSGGYEDLMDVIRFANKEWSYPKIQMAGFSLGGNMTLLCLGKEGNWLKSNGIERAIAISAPLNLAASSRKLEAWWNFPYRINFLRELRNKINQKEKQHPGQYRLQEINKASTLFEFDDAATGPIHGFQGAEHYYRSCSSLYVLDKISIPTLLILAVNDPMLARGNYEEILSLNPNLEVRILPQGGHCGFWGMGIF